MKKTLVIVAHPGIEESIVNKSWVRELNRYPEEFTVHELYAAYPSGEVDVRAEQRLIESHDALVLQFPFYWFNCPPLLKKWLDDVFTYGWAYGSDGDKLKGRTVALAVSAGIAESDFQEGGRYKYSLNDILVPFEVSFNYVGACYKQFFALYGAGEEVDSDVVAKSSRDYVEFLRKLV